MGLVQIDGSEHRWFGPDHPACTLLVFIDDATGRLMQLRITMIAAANAYLPGFMERFNGRFARPPARPGDLHRPLKITLSRLNDILCRREMRHVGHQLLSWPSVVTRTVWLPSLSLQLPQLPSARGALAGSDFRLAADR